MGQLLMANSYVVGLENGLLSALSTTGWKCWSERERERERELIYIRYCLELSVLRTLSPVAGLALLSKNVDYAGTSWEHRWPRLHLHLRRDLLSLRWLRDFSWLELGSREEEISENLMYSASLVLVLNEREETVPGIGLGVTGNHCRTLGFAQDVMVNWTRNRSKHSRGKKATTNKRSNKLALFDTKNPSKVGIFRTYKSFVLAASKRLG